MKQLINTFLIILLLNFTQEVSAQDDNNTYEVFNNIQLSEDQIYGFGITSSYYTIDNNISNKESSVFVNEKPSITAYRDFALDLPSHLFIIHLAERVQMVITVQPKKEGNKTTWIYNVRNTKNGKSVQKPCTVSGEITDTRAEELLKLKIDPTAKFIESKDKSQLFLFNGINYQVQSFEKVKSEVSEVAKQLLNPDPVAYIKKESIGGKMDFVKSLEKESQSTYLINEVTYNKKDFAIYSWGKKVKQLQIKTAEEASDLWQEIYKRKLSSKEKKALTEGYNSNTK